MEPIRILHINGQMYCAGVETFLMNIYRNIDREKIQFDFLVHYSERKYYDNEIEDLGGRIYRMSIREDNNFMKYFLELKKFFKEHTEYKIVHAHMESFAMFYLPFAKVAGIPIIIGHSHNDKVVPSLKGYLKRFMNIPFKYLATDYLACSEESGRFLFGNRPTEIIPNAIDAQRFRFNPDVRSKVRRELNIENKFAIGHVGRFHPQKNHAFLIDIFYEVYKKNQNAILLLIGDGELKAAIKRKVIELGLVNQVKFLGVRSDTNELYQAMDVFVLPSLFEGLGIVGIEAQAAALHSFCIDTIPKIAWITDYFHPCSLKDSATSWGEEINYYSHGYQRTDTYREIVSAGFDMSTQIKDLERLYISKYSQTTNF